MTILNIKYIILVLVVLLYWYTLLMKTILYITFYQIMYGFINQYTLYFQK